MTVNREPLLCGQSKTGDVILRWVAGMGSIGGVGRKGEGFLFYHFFVCYSYLSTMSVCVLPLCLASLNKKKLKNLGL